MPGNQRYGLTVKCQPSRVGDDLLDEEDEGGGSSYKIGADC
jgi:hypothetical protein